MNERTLNRLGYPKSGTHSYSCPNVIFLGLVSLYLLKRVIHFTMLPLGQTIQSQIIG